MCKGRAQSCRASLKTSEVIFTAWRNLSPKTSLSVKSPASDFIWKTLISLTPKQFICHSQLSLSSSQLYNKSAVKALLPPSTSTDLYCCVLGGRYHDTEDGVENDAGDRTAVATQRVLFWRAWDPLFGVTLQSYWPTQSELVFSFIQFGFKLHHLARVHGDKSWWSL